MEFFRHNGPVSGLYFKLTLFFYAYLATFLFKSMTFLLVCRKTISFWGKLGSLFLILIQWWVKNILAIN